MELVMRGIDFLARAMMFDMRGFPDTEGLCKIRGGAGFWRNDTDCTQFFRCQSIIKKVIHFLDRKISYFFVC